MITMHDLASNVIASGEGGGCADLHGEGGKGWGRSAWGGREEVGEGMWWGHLPSMCKRRNIKSALFWHKIVIIYPQQPFFITMPII